MLDHRGTRPSLGTQACKGHDLFCAFLVDDEYVRRSLPGDHGGEQGQGVAVFERDSLRLFRLFREDDHVERFLLAADEDEIVAFPQLHLQDVALVAFQLDLDPRVHVETGSHLGEIVHVGRLDDRSVHAKAHFDALVEAGVEHCRARGALVRVLQGGERVRMLGHPLAGRAVNVPVKVEEAALGHVEEGAECVRLVHFSLGGESVGVDIVQLRVIHGEHEALDLVHHFPGHDGRGLLQFFIQRLLVEDLHSALLLHGKLSKAKGARRG